MRKLLSGRVARIVGLFMALMASLMPGMAALADNPVLTGAAFWGDPEFDAGKALSYESVDVRVRVWRGGTDGAFQEFEVPRRESQTVLDVVTHIQRALDPTLAYRYACRVGMCGSCAMTVNGAARWTCRTHVDKVAKDGRLTVAPLRNLPVIRDLVAFEPEGRSTDLAASLTYAVRLLNHRSIVVVLSDFLAPSWERPLQRLAARHEVVAVTVDDPRERALPASGWLDLEDAESGRRVLVDAGSREVRGRLASLAERRVEERRRGLAAAGVDHVALITGQDYALPLRRAFALRAKRLHR